MNIAQVKNLLKTATGTDATVAEIGTALSYTPVLREIGAQIDFLRRKDDRSAQVTIPAGKIAKPPKTAAVTAQKPKVS